VILRNKLGARLWLLIDEWSTLPESLQPYFAVFIRRSLFPIRECSVHIAAIEHRSTFRLGHGSDIIGIELGADAFADMNLDDHLVFENSPMGSMAFFKNMFFRHLKVVDEHGDLPAKDADEFVRTSFTQELAFQELVRACEGVPRDAINILRLAAVKAGEQRISIPHVREAAKAWYDRDKSAYVNSNEEARALLAWIVNEVISGRKARAFLVNTDASYTVMDRLYDERILHIARKSYSTKQEPGVRFKVWKIDYGCYVDLINTSRAPTGFLFEGIEADGEEIAAPVDDLRAIRHRPARSTRCPVVMRRRRDFSRPRGARFTDCRGWRVSLTK